MVLNLQDAALGTTITLPNGAAATKWGVRPQTRTWSVR